MKSKMMRIADYLLLFSPHIRDVGLFHGKMGIAMALYMYSSKYCDEQMGEFAWELFRQVYDGVHCDMAVGLENGLAGIGYGTTLLNVLGLLDGNIDEALIDIDRKIMERDPRRMTDMSTRSGAGGILLYLSLRQSLGNGLRTFDDVYLQELQNTCGDMPQAATTDILRILYEPESGPNDYIGRPLGIDGGCAFHLVKSYLS